MTDGKWLKRWHGTPEPRFTRHDGFFLTLEAVALGEASCHVQQPYEEARVVRNWGVPTKPLALGDREAAEHPAGHRTAPTLDKDPSLIVLVPRLRNLG